MLRTEYKNENIINTDLFLETGSNDLGQIDFGPHLPILTGTLNNLPEEEVSKEVSVFSDSNHGQYIYM